FDDEQGWVLLHSPCLSSVWQGHWPIYPVQGNRPTRLFLLDTLLSFLFQEPVKLLVDVMAVGHRPLDAVVHAVLQRLKKPIHIVVIEPKFLVVEALGHMKIDVT